MEFDKEQPQGTPANELQSDKYNELLQAGLIDAANTYEPAEINFLYQQFLEQKETAPNGNGSEQPLQQETGSNTMLEMFAPIIAEDATIGVQPPKKHAKEKPVATEKKRGAITVNPTIASMEYLQPVIDYHIAMGWAKNAGDFFIKCADFAINLGHYTGNQYFGVPDGHTYKLLENGFPDFAANPNGLETCKQSS